MASGDTNAVIAARERAEELYRSGQFLCSEAVFTVANDHLGRPLPEETVRLAKDAVLREAFRVLKPGGRFAVADVVIQGRPLPPAIQQLMALWTGCIACALTEDEYRQKLSAAGFADTDLLVLKTYGAADVPEDLRRFVPADLGLEPGSQVVSAFVKAIKA